MNNSKKTYDLRYMRTAMRYLTSKSPLIGLWCLFFMLIGVTLQAQKVYLPEIDSTEEIYFYHFDKKKAISNHTGNDTVKMSIKIPKLNEVMSIFPGNAEINILRLKDTVIYSGKYMDRTKVYNPNDNYFLVLPENASGQIAELTSYNISTLDFFMAPYITTQKSVEFHITKFVLDGEIGIFTSVSFLGGILVLFVFFTINYLSDRKFKDYLYFSIYLGTILIYNIIQIDYFLRFYFLFPKNPIIYHQIYDSFALLLYVVYIFFIIKLLDLDKVNAKLAKRTRLSGSFLLFGSMMFLTFGILKDFAAIQKTLVWIYIISLAIGVFIVFDILKHMKNRLTFLAMIGSLCLIIGVMGEFITSRVFEDSYYWNLERPLFVQLFPINLTQYGNWIHLIFFAMVIGYKYRQTDISTLEMQESNLKKLQNDTSFEIQKVQLLSEALSKQNNQLSQKNQLFDFLQTQVGTVKQQLNPTFISNILESIALNIQSNDNQIAQKKIAIVGQFLHNVIASSEETSIRLSQEIESLKMFIEFEELRLNESFNIEIDIGSDLEQFMIPPFIFQEYMEKILWNYNRNNEGTYLIQIGSEIKNDTLELTIKETSASPIWKSIEENQTIIQRIENRLGERLDSNYSVIFNQMADLKSCKLSLNIDTQN